MSFHHAQPHKSSSSGNGEPLDLLSQHIDNEMRDLIEVSDQRFSDSRNYDDEARFELLSAYLDGEVTAEERKLVAQWLMDEPNTQQMYQRLLMLRQAIRTAPVPAQPPLQVPAPPQHPWGSLSSWPLRQTLVCIIAIALLGSLSQLGTTNGRQHLQEAWQFIKTLPVDAFVEIASTEQLDNPAK
ncbi:MAG: hypothetical protein AAGF93_24380 [Cyanobacteria bacterium P01_H01_bin.105]